MSRISVVLLLTIAALLLLFPVALRLGPAWNDLAFVFFLGILLTALLVALRGRVELPPGTSAVVPSRASRRFVVAGSLSVWGLRQLVGYLYGKPANDVIAGVGAAAVLLIGVWLAIRDAKRS